jgi:hypothetical protein
MKHTVNAQRFLARVVLCDAQLTICKASAGHWNKLLADTCKKLDVIHENLARRKQL